jgi:hypothetical protein
MKNKNKNKETKIFENGPYEIKINENVFSGNFKIKKIELNSINSKENNNNTSENIEVQIIEETINDETMNDETIFNQFSKDEIIFTHESKKNEEGVINEKNETILEDPTLDNKEKEVYFNEEIIDNIINDISEEDLNMEIIKNWKGHKNMGRVEYLMKINEVLVKQSEELLGLTKIVDILNIDVVQNKLKIHLKAIDSHHLYEKKIYDLLDCYKCRMMGQEYDSVLKERMRLKELIRDIGSEYVVLGGPFVSSEKLVVNDYILKVENYSKFIIQHIFNSELKIVPVLLNLSSYEYLVFKTYLVFKLIY